MSVEKPLAGTNGTINNAPVFNIPVLDINVTGACNLECSYCFGEVDTKSGMARATFAQALQFAHFTGAKAVELCGGEPLLYPDLSWAVKAARYEGFDLILRTNGHLLPEWRRFVSENFRAVGISLDGDAESNHRMRPLKRKGKMSAEEKFDIPLREIANLKALRPELRVVLSSVATAENRAGILALGRILVHRKVPLNLWKVQQFVANKFRSLDHEDRFRLGAETFAALENDVTTLLEKHIPVVFRKSDEIDGSCLIISRDGDALLGARRVGNVMHDRFDDICARLIAATAETPISMNKSITYGVAISKESDVSCQST